MSMKVYLSEDTQNIFLKLAKHFQVRTDSSEIDKRATTVIMIGLVLLTLLQELNQS